MTEQNSEQPQQGSPGAQDLPPPPQQGYPGPESSPPPGQQPPPGDQGYQGQPGYQAQPGYPPSQPGYPPQAGYPAPAYGGQVQPYQYGPPGKIRSSGITVLLWIVTLGIYGWYWFYQNHEDMKRHSGDGMGGPLALVLAIFVGIVMPYITSSEVGKLYERQGREAPVSALTGLWVFPGIFILVGPFIWLVKTNGALNRYWESMGVQP
jgi:hypothetical protein